MSDFESRNQALVWAAGYLCAQGTLTVLKNEERNPKVRLVITSLRDTEALQQWAAIMRVGVREHKVRGKVGVMLAVTGAPLHDVMIELWPYITTSRKREYADCRRRAELALSHD